MKMKLIISPLVALMALGSSVQASDLFEERLSSLVDRGRVSVLELSEEQQDAYGIEVLEVRISALLEEAGDAPTNSQSRRIDFLASQLATIVVANTAADSDLTRTVFREIRSERTRARVLPLISAAEESDPAAFADALAATIERLTPEVVVVADDEQLVELQNDLDLLVRSRDSIAARIEASQASGITVLERTFEALARIEALIVETEAAIAAL